MFFNRVIIVSLTELGILRGTNAYIMFKKYLKKISHIEITVIWGIKIEDWKVINTGIFGKDFSWDPLDYKIHYFSKLEKKERKLIELQIEIQKEYQDQKKKWVLLKEIHSRLQKISFLKDAYDVEANKIDSNIFVCNTIDYDHYNQLFYWITQSRLKKDYYLKECIHIKRLFTKKELCEIIEYSNSLIPKIDFVFGDYANFSHYKWAIRITDKKNYNIQNIISIFFHEVTHFFRWENGLKNLWFRYNFQHCGILEEGIALYNEYKYGNRITQYWEFNPYYDMCYKILTENISETEKKDKIYHVLKCKWYTREKSLTYYYRFYKYASIWTHSFFLKDLIYTKGYGSVKKLLSQDPRNYEKIMAWKIWSYELENWILNSENNYDSKKYFNSMVREIKKYCNS